MSDCEYAESIPAPQCPAAEERDTLRAEVERLREALRDVAKRQREACAEYLKHWTYDEHTLSRVRATPLVTEEQP